MSDGPAERHRTLPPPMDLPASQARLRAALDAAPLSTPGVTVNREDLETLLAAAEYVQTMVPALVDLTRRAVAPLVGTFRRTCTTLGIEVPDA